MKKLHSKMLFMQLFLRTERDCPHHNYRGERGHKKVPFLPLIPPPSSAIIRRPFFSPSLCCFEFHSAAAAQSALLRLYCSHSSPQIFPKAFNSRNSNSMGRFIAFTRVGSFSLSLQGSKSAAFPGSNPLLSSVILTTHQE